LLGQGVNPGPIDGIMGARTGRALREFQQEKGMTADGQLNGETLEALHLEIGMFMGIAPRFEIEPENQAEQQEMPREEAQQYSSVPETVQAR
jgi:peptidoglycan hydrolase-like protein with peptidoglycan-binding domain